MESKKRGGGTGGRVALVATVGRARCPHRAARSPRNRRILLLYACCPSVAATIPNYRLSPHGGAVRADGITSANTVGYTSQEVKAGQFYMVGVQFADVKATDTVDLNTLLSATCAPGEIGDGEAPHPPTHTLPIMSRSFAILSAWRTGS